MVKARHVQVIEEGTKLICMQSKEKQPQYVNVKLNDYETQSEARYISEASKISEQSSVEHDEVFDDAQDKSENRSAYVSVQN